ncbi:hypothetical protein FHR24_002972 [Wenyingzhuangia heitensis]|uniref:MetA-pathway of phenol degradation n=1 Tax=Wenyingzhuangia heitensis TaxID=1487859 RepID=A0ABX0UCB8_9FLAO|nr:hypothetical protein [Wenyingzhuangia heitensis]NIJ46484.1 hypothetical protein [Wenyingzhuangia heitensis]
MKNKFIMIAMLLFTANVMAQWTKGKGNGYFKLSTWYLQADEHFTDSGDKSPLTTRGVFNVSLYGEYGLTDKLDIIAYIPFYVRSFQNKSVSATRGTVVTEGAALNSFGDTDIGIRYSLLKNSKLAVSSTLKFGIPLGETEGGNERAVLQNGDGEFNQQLQVDLGIPFVLGNLGAYAKTHLAYNHRTEGFSDEVYYGGELGVQFFNRLWLIGRLTVLESTRNGSLSDAGSVNGSIFANNIEYTNLGAEVAYYITSKVGLSFTYTSVVSGRIIVAAPSYSGGVFLDL